MPSSKCCQRSSSPMTTKERSWGCAWSWRRACHSSSLSIFSTRVPPSPGFLAAASSLAHTPELSSSTAQTPTTATRYSPSLSPIFFSRLVTFRDQQLENFNTKFYLLSAIQEGFISGHHVVGGGIFHADCCQMICHYLTIAVCMICFHCHSSSWLLFFHFFVVSK